MRGLRLSLFTLRVSRVALHASLTFIWDVRYEIRQNFAAVTAFLSFFAVRRRVNHLALELVT